MENILTFDYRLPHEICRWRSKTLRILDQGLSAIEQPTDWYLLHCEADDPHANTCMIHEIMYYDFDQPCVSEEPRFRLKELEAQCSEKLFAAVFPKDDHNIKRKLLNTINITIDKVYNCEELLIIFSRHSLGEFLVFGVPKAIYQVLHENFDITYESVDNFDSQYISIKKRSKDHDNNAN